MHRVATISIVLAAAFMLLPWQICDCDDDGPHLKALWDQVDCHPTDAPASGDDAGEPAPDCGALFQFEGAVASAAEPTAAPFAERAIALPAPEANASLVTAAAGDDRALDWPPTNPASDTPVALATRLLV